MKYSTDWNNFRLMEGDDGAGGGSGGSGSGEGGSGDGEGGSGTTTLLSGGEGGSGGSDDGSGGSGGSDDGSGGSGDGGGQSGNFLTGLYDEHGNLNKDNFDNLPAHLVGHKETFCKYDTMEALLGGFSNALNVAGKKGLQPLPSDAPKEVLEERSALMKTLNRTPDEPTGYKFDKPDDVDETIWNGLQAENYAKILHKHNASPELAAELFAAQMEQAKAGPGEIQAAIDAQIVSETKELKKVTGDKYNETILLAGRGIEIMAIDGFTVNSPEFKSHKVVLMAAEISKLSKEDDLSGMGGGGGSGENPREEALSIVSGEHSRWGKAYNDAEDPMHEDAISAKQALDKKARKLGLLKT